jgi:hypothetical protein
MALYNFQCKNKNCKEYLVTKELFIFNMYDTQLCTSCEEELVRLFPFNVHIKGVERDIDGVDIGKVTEEKNISLKKKWSGYEYEEQNLRKKVTKMTEDRIKRRET